MKIILGLVIVMVFVAGCDRQTARPPSASPVTQYWNPPRDSTNIVILSSSVEGGTRYKFEVHRTRIEKLPDWSALSNTIPLLPHQAAQLAVARYRSLYPSLTNIQVCAISLQTICWFDLKWAYHVSLKSEKDRLEDRRLDWPRSAIVLLDGTVVDPAIDRGPERGPRIHL